MSRPVLEAKVAHRGGRIRRLAYCKRPCLDGGSSHQRVRKIGELLGPHPICGDLAIARELDLRLDTRETERMKVWSVEQRTRCRRNESCVEKYIDDGGDRIGRLLRSGHFA